MKISMNFWMLCAARDSILVENVAKLESNETTLFQIECRGLITGRFGSDDHTGVEIMTFTCQVHFTAKLQQITAFINSVIILSRTFLYHRTLTHCHGVHFWPLTTYFHTTISGVIFFCLLVTILLFRRSEWILHLAVWPKIQFQYL